MSLSDHLIRWNPWRGLGALPRDVWILSLTTLVNRLGTMVLPFLALYVTLGLHYSAARAGTVLFLYGLGAIVAAPLMGRVCDRLGAQRVMRGTLILSGCVMFVFPLCRSWPLLLGATLLLSLASEGYRPASFAALTDAAPESQRKAAFSMLRLAVNLGMSVGPAVGGFLATVSYPALFVVDGATSLLAGAVMTIWPVGSAARAASPAPAVAGGDDPPGEPSRPARRNGLFLYFLLALIPVIMVFFQHVGAMPLHLVGDLDFSPRFIGFMFTINTIVIVLLEVRLNMATARWPHGRALALGALLTGLGFGALAWCRTGWQILATVIVWTFGEMILLPSMAAQVADFAPADRRGEYMGFYSMAFGIAFSVGPWLGTTLLGAYGGAVVWTSCLVVAFVSAALFWRLPRTP